MTNHQKTIIITGASGGLGSALAKDYALQNCKLFLFGRSEAKLNQLKEECLRLGASLVSIEIADVRDKSLMDQLITNICTSHNVDIIIASAGVSAGTLGGFESAEQTQVIFDTNLTGTINSIMPAINFMIRNKQGKIALVSSMAGLFPLSSAPSYSSSKASILCYGNSLRGYLKQFNIQVCVVVPGFIDTPMTLVNNFPMPFKTSAKQASQKIITGINKNRGLIIFPKLSYYLLKLASLLPHQLIDYINSKLPGKPSLDGGLVIKPD